MRRLSWTEKALVMRALSTEFRGSKNLGFVSRAENAFAALIGTRNAVACVNGTATLHLALEAIGVGAGDEVIVPPLTMSATSLAVLHANATPVFADVNPLTWQLDAASVAENITSRTRAIISVALYGGCPDYSALLEVAGPIPLIEDNAEALGTTYKEKNIGSFGLFSSYSFQSSKHLTSGEGGFLCSNSDDHTSDARVMQTLGYSAVRDQSTRRIPKALIQDPAYLRHESLGWNYRVSEVTGALMLGQIKRAEKLVERRRREARKILDLIKEVDWLRPQVHHEGVVSSSWSVAVSLDKSRVAWRPFFETFVANGGKGFYGAWALTYREPAFRSTLFHGREKFLTRSAEELFADGQCPNAERLQPTIMAFRTNNWNNSVSSSQLKALESTLRHFRNS